MEGTTTIDRTSFDSALRESEHRHALLFKGAQASLFVFDVDTLEILAANDAALLQYGYSRDELLARTMPELRHQERRGFWRSHSALRAGHNVFEVSRHVRRDGTVFDVEVHTSSIPTLGSRIRVARTTDITQQRQLVDVGRFLDNATGILSSALEMGMVCRHLAMLAVPTLAEWCVVHLPNERSVLAPCSYTHANPLQQGILVQAVEDRGDVAKEHAAFRAWCTGKTQVIAGNARDQVFRGVVARDELDANTALYVPLLGRAGTLGVIECVSGARSESDLLNARMLAEALAERASLAIDNALLYAESRRANRARRLSSPTIALGDVNVLERIPESCMLLAADFKIRFLNAEGERMLQRPRDEMIGEVLWDLFPGTLDDPFHSAYERAMHERVDVAFDAWYEGLSTWYRIHARPWGDGIAVFFHDIGPQQHSIQRAAESETEFADFLESATDLIHMLSPDGRILYANGAWREKLGYTAEEIADLRMLDVVAPECRDAARSVFLRCVAGETSVESEMTVLAKDGRRIIVRGKANCRMVDGRAVSTRGIYRDVTSEVESAELLQRARRTEASAMRAKTAFLDRVSHELRTPLAAIIGFSDILGHNREERLSATELNFVQRIGVQGRSLLSLVEDVLAYADIESRRVDFDLMTVNLSSLLREVAQLYTAEMPHAETSVEVNAPSTVMLDTDAATLRRILRYLLNDAVKRGRGGDVSVTLLTDDTSGAARAIEVTDSGLNGATHTAEALEVERESALELGLTVARSLCQLLGYHFSTYAGDHGGTVRRIELRGVSARDTRVEDETATTLHAFLQASPLPIVAFEPDWTVRIWNATAARTFGWTSADVIEKRLPLLRPEDEPAFRELLRDALESTSGIADVPAVHLMRDGSAIDVHVSIAPLRTIDGRLRGFISIIADVSERKRMESELRRAHKMEVVGMLAGGVAHDFNNLLTVISAHTQFLLSEPGLDESFREDATAIGDAADRAAALTRQLMLFSRKQVAERRLLDLNVKLRNVERMLRRTIGSHIEFVAVAWREPVIVLADPGQVEQIIMNLVLNARDAMPDGGALVVETSIVNEEGTDIALLTVSDTGIGMDATTAERVFEPYFTTKEPGKGTGLGLATVNSIVHNSGGVIAVESAPGEGATFRVRLPLAERRLAEEDQSAEARTASEGYETVLLVEDQDAVRNIAARILRAHGYQVLPARHGNDALAIVASHAGRIDLLLSDLVMPEMNGHLLAARVRERVPDIRVVFMSGYSESVQGGSPVDPTIPVVAKPFDASGLVQAVRCALDAHH